LALDQWKEAWTPASPARSLSGGQPMCDGFFGYIAGTSGHTARARAVLNDLTARRRHGYSPAPAIALTYHGLGDANAWPDCLETAFEEGNPFLMELMVWPGYDPLRSSERFRGLTRRLQVSGK
jgi:hypothetical protein